VYHEQAYEQMFLGNGRSSGICHSLFNKPSNMGIGGSMTVFIIMEWDSGELYPTGVGYTDEQKAIDDCDGKEGWLEYKAIEVAVTQVV
jgi:hypothetical protein